MRMEFRLSILPPEQARKSQVSSPWGVHRTLTAPGRCFREIKLEGAVLTGLENGVAWFHPKRAAHQARESRSNQMKEVNILGASHATISMIVETLGSLHPTGVRVNIVHNVVVEDELPYDVPSVETIKTAHEDWDYEADARKKVPCLCGVYRPSVKKQVFRFFRSRCGTELEHYANLIHPATALASTTRLGTGVTIGPQTVIAPHSFIGDLVSVNRSVSIGHHTVVGNYSTLNPGCNVAGRCRIGTGVTVGMGTNIVEDVTLGDNAVVGAGALVTRDVPPGVVVYGVPARIVRTVT